MQNNPTAGLRKRLETVDLVGGVAAIKLGGKLMKLRDLEPKRTTKTQRIIVRRQFEAWRRGTIELNGRSYRRWYKQQKNKQFGKCFYCSEKLIKERVEVDHRIPVYKGGTNDSCNLVLSCKECNRFKSTHVLMKKRQTQLKAYQRKVLSC